MIPQKKVGIVLIVGIVLSAASPVTAWDGERRGFILGAGGGLGFVTIIEDDANTVFDPPRSNSFALGADAQIGVAPNNKVEYYLFGNSSWLSYKDRFTLNQLTGLGFTYYLKQEFLPPAPSPFFFMGIGVDVLKTIDGSLPSRYGFGLMFGGGYEFRRYVRVKGSIKWSNPNTKLPGFKKTSYPWILRVLLSVQGY